MIEGDKILRPQCLMLIDCVLGCAVSCVPVGVQCCMCSLLCACRCTVLYVAVCCVPVGVQCCMLHTACELVITKYFK